MEKARGNLPRFDPRIEVSTVQIYKSSGLDLHRLQKNLGAGAVGVLVQLPARPIGERQGPILTTSSGHIPFHLYQLVAVEKRIGFGDMSEPARGAVVFVSPVEDIE